jgi:hypothetical protein
LAFPGCEFGRAAIIGCGSTLLRETSRFHFWVNGSKRGTRGQLVEVPVSVQVAKIFWDRDWWAENVKVRTLEPHRNVISSGAEAH